MQDAIRDNAFLFAIVVSGIVILGFGYVPPHSEMLIALGAAFIIAGAVGIYMMLATRQVARKLHERFNEQNDILKEIASSQKEIASSQKEMTSSQKEMTSSQKQNHSEMMGILKSISNTLEKKL